MEIQGQEELVEAEIDVAKRYVFPSEIETRKYGDKYLVIYTEGISWLVLQDDEELSVFKYLQEGYSINEALSAYDEEAVAGVVTQIEAKHFDRPVALERETRSMYALLTNRCNLRCRHCYMYAGEREFKELPLEQWRQVLRDFRECRGTGVTFTGGEVTIFDGYEQLIMFAHEIGLSVTVLTNGILWTDELIDKLHGAIDEVQVSVDGYDPESYRRVRRYDGFDRALHCIRGFYSAGTKVSMAVTPLYDNIDNFVDKFEPFARAFLQDCPDVFIKLNLELIEGREIKVSKKQNLVYKDKLKRLVERLYPDYYVETFALNYENHILRRNCGFGEITVAANGDVYWCNRIPELSTSSNVLERSIAAIVEDSEGIKKGTSVDNTVGCEQCDIRYVCGGGCRLQYDGIRDVENHHGKWLYNCPGKDDIYERMILGNEYFYETA